MEGKGRGRTEQRKRLGCDANLTKVSVNQLSSSGDGSDVSHAGPNEGLPRKEAWPWARCFLGKGHFLIGLTAEGDWPMALLAPRRSVWSTAVSTTLYFDTVLPRADSGCH